MVNFGLHLSLNQKPDWQEKYIDYELLKAWVNAIKADKINAEETFIDVLEKEWVKYHDFINEFIAKLDKDTVSKDHLSDILEMNSFMEINQECLRKIIKKHDKNSAIKLLPSWTWKIKCAPFFSLFEALGEISKLYDEPRIKSDVNEIDNENFVRKSLKYWVKMDEVVPLISKIIQHLPIYVFNEEKADASIASSIDSVYYDNSAMDIFRDRYKKAEGAKLFRIRYYGGNIGDKVYMERKIHHEKWSGHSSTKERFSLNSDCVNSYLKGDYKIDEPKKPDLVEDFFHSVNSMGLQPVVRSSYKRIAFQLRTNNDVRISLDTDLKFIKELASSGNWYTPDEMLSEKDISTFPFAVCEVKLSNEFIEMPPTWLADLMNDTNLLIPAAGFSKFLHGAYIFRSQYAPDIPFWINDNWEIFGTTIRSGRKSGSDFKSISLVDATEGSSVTDKYEMIASSDIEAGLKFGENTTTTSSSKATERISLLASVANFFGPNDASANQIVRSKVAKGTHSPRLKIEPKTFFANERTFLQWFNAAVLLSTIGITIYSMGLHGVGLSIAITGFLTLAYAAFMYYRRNKTLTEHRTDIPLHDTYGPLVLSFVLIVGLTCSLLFA